MPFVVIHTVPGTMDGWSLRRTVVAYTVVKAIRPDVQGAVVFNRVDRTALCRAARASTDGLGVPVLDETLGHRVAFGEAMLLGKGVLQTAPESDAALEVRRLTQALLRTLKDPDAQTQPR